MTSQNSIYTSDVVEVPPHPTGDELINRATALRPEIRATRHESTERGTYSLELHEAFMEAGFYRILQPRKYGGFEFDLETNFAVMVELCRADPGAGWGLALSQAHTIPLVAHFSESVVEEAYSDKGIFISPHSSAPRGVAKPVAGGYVVTGQWGYSSGSPHSTHAMVTALTEEAGQKKPIVALIPRKDYTILDDWGGGLTMALSASGSNSIKVEEVFVPNERTSDWNWQLSAFSEGSYGVASTNNTMYLGNCLIPYVGSIACAQIGAARGILDEFETLLSTKKRIYPPQILRAQHEDGQHAYGSALAMVDSAETLLLSAGRKHMELGERWRSDNPASLEDYQRAANMVYMAIRLSYEAGELVFRSSGSSVARVGDPIQEYFLSLQMQRPQANETFDNAARMVARSHFGLDMKYSFNETVAPTTKR